MNRPAQAEQAFGPLLPARRSNLLMPLATVAIVLFSAASGVLLAGYDVLGMAAILGAAGGLLSLLLPLRYVVALLLVSAFLVMGQLLYFARINQSLWLPFLLGLALLVRYPAELIWRNKGRASQAPFQPVQSPLVNWLLAFYFATVLAGTLMNLSSPLQVFVSSKEYFFLWGLYLVIAAGLISPVVLEKIWIWLPWLLPLQVPIVLYQRFVVAPRRAVEHLGAKWDAVVGAFGGDPDSGGASGAMGIFVVFSIALCVARWRQGQMRGWHCAVIVGSGLLALLLAEVKFAVLLLPLALAIVLARDFVARPASTLGWFAAALLLAGGLIFAYKAQYGNSYQDSKNGGYAESALSASTDPNFINLQTGEMGRISALKFWAAQQTNGFDRLIGEGMGASRKGSMVIGDAAARWTFNIARSAMAILLWETGLIGTGAFILMLAAAYLRAHVLARDKRIPETERIALLAGSAGLVILLLELPYNTDMFFSPQIQIVLILILGQIAVSGGRIVMPRGRS